MKINAGESTWFEIPIMAEARNEVGVTEENEIREIGLSLTIEIENDGEFSAAVIRKELP